MQPAVMMTVLAPGLAGRNRVVSPSSPGMTTQHAPQGQDSAAQRAMPGNRLHCIFAAARRITAGRRQYRGKQHPVAVDRCAQDLGDGAHVWCRSICRGRRNRRSLSFSILPKPQPFECGRKVFKQRSVGPPDRLCPGNDHIVVRVLGMSRHYRVDGTSKSPPRAVAFDRIADLLRGRESHTKREVRSTARPGLQNQAR